MTDTLAELEAMKQVAEAIATLEPDAKARVLSWAADHYSVGAIKSSIHESDPQEEETNTKQEFDTLGDLFAQAQPGSDAEKALVAGYWLQIEQGNDDFATQDINSELKHLGYGIGNITRAFENLKKTRPQQVIQLRKAGTSKQARKTFKVTDVGRKVVDSMIRDRNVE